MVQIVPINDNVPVVTVETRETYYEENAPPQRVLPDITITDEDEYCENDQLSAAVVQVVTLTNDSSEDQLTVRITITLYYTFIIIGPAVCKTALCVYIQLERGGVEIVYTPSTDPCPEIGDVSSSSLIWYTCRTPRRQLQLVISGAADLSIYQQLLRTVAYSNDMLEPDKNSLTRTISVSTSTYPLLQ